MILSELNYCSSDRVLLKLEDGSEISSYLSVIAELHLHALEDLDQTRLEQIREKTALLEAKEYALRTVAKRMYSRKELGDRFARHGIPSHISEPALDWMESHGYLDDAQYAQAIIRHYSAKGYGISRLRSELYKRGISQELQKEILSALPDNTQAIDRLLKSRLRDPDNRDEVRKAANYLTRRGFSWDEIKSALERYHET